MHLVTILRLRLRSLLSRTRLDEELDEELRYHLERQIEEDLAAQQATAQATDQATGRSNGLTPRLAAAMDQDAARLLARRAATGVEQRKEECRDMRGITLIDHLRQDGQFAIRQLRKHPGFTCATIFMLALGLCASVAIFAFVDATLIKPLPYQQSSRLVGVYETVALFPRSNLSYPDYLDWKRLNTVFSSLEVYEQNRFVLSTPSGVESAPGARVSDGFFRTLGVTPLLGRDFAPGEDLPSAPHTVILSYAAWQKRYGGSADVLGRTVTLGGTPNVIIGVLPRTFHFSPAEPVELWTTLHASSGCDLRRSCHSLFGIARLKDGVSVETARANVETIAGQLEQQYPDSNRGQGGTVVALSEVIVGNLRPILLVLLGGAGLLLLIAGVNVASLLLVRAESRTREMAVRTALGASSARLVRQFVVEALVLVGAASALGLTAAHWVMRFLTTLIPESMLASMSFLEGLGLNARVCAFAGVIALVAVVVFAITPTLRVSLSPSQAGLAEGSRGSAGVTWRRLGSRLVVLELATAMVPLVGAGLLGKSLYHLLRVDVGMRPEGLATLQVGASRTKYAKEAQLAQLQREIVRRVAQLPGVASVGIANRIPLSGNGNTTWFRVLGRPWHGEHNEAPEREVSPTYFATLGATLVRGRYFTETDDASRPRVAIINQALARLHFPNDNPIGKQLSYLTDPPQPIEIVGVVENIKEGPLDVETPPALYIPFNQSTSSGFGVVVRTSSPAERALLPTLAATIREIDPGILTGAAMTMNDRIRNSSSAYLHRSSAWLVGGFAVLALGLGVVGLYGVVAYSVSQRRREIGVRIALGARPGVVYRLIMREAAWLTTVGMAIGLVCSIAAATLIRDLLFGVESWDLPTLAVVAVVLAVSALLASFIPARRAASVDPVEALRTE